MLPTLPNTAVLDTPHIHVSTNPHLSLDVILQTDTDLLKSNCSEYLESWRRGTEDVFDLVL